MSRYHDSSEVSVFNRHISKEPFFVSKDTAELLDKTLEVSALTKGAFDVTVGPLTELWGFDEKQRRATRPQPGEIAQARSMVGYHQLRIDVQRSLVQKKIPQISIDLSAVAKGYAVDRIALVLERLGYDRYLVEIGGEIRVMGKNERGRPWRVAVETPGDKRRKTFQTIELTGGAVATSGDYRNYYELDGRRISHNIDPRTGSPVTHRLASVTVVHEECAVADALATGLMVLGPKKGFALAQEQDLPVLFISRRRNGRLIERATAAFIKLRVGQDRPGSEEKENK